MSERWVWGALEISDNLLGDYMLGNAISTTHAVTPRPRGGTGFGLFRVACFVSKSVISLSRHETQASARVSSGVRGKVQAPKCEA